MIRSIIVFLLVDLIRSDELCAKGSSQSDALQSYCLGQHGSLIQRCCFASISSELIGIDLTDLNLAEVPPLNSSIRLIDLRGNAALRQRTDSDFLQLQRLEDLFLPEHFLCPGGNEVWRSIEHLTDASTLAGYHCHEQKDFCLNRTDLCPADRSFCNCNGPNHFLCLCRDGFFGYKCLRRGEFPFGRFLTATTVITIILSTIFYWTHRRNVTAR